MHAAIGTDIYDDFRWVIILKMQDPWWSENQYSNWVLLSLLWPPIACSYMRLYGVKANYGGFGRNVWHWQHLVFHHSNEYRHKMWRLSLETVGSDQDKSISLSSKSSHQIIQSNWTWLMAKLVIGMPKGSRQIKLQLSRNCK